MSELIKIIVLGIAASVCVVVLKPIKPEFGILVSVACGVLILILSVDMLSNVFSSFDKILTKTGIDKELFKILLKIIGVGYMTEFAANICYDSQNAAIADKILFGGKVVIMLVALPILSSILDIITALIS